MLLRAHKGHRTVYVQTTQLIELNCYPDKNHIITYYISFSYTYYILFSLADTQIYKERWVKKLFKQIKH